MSNSYSDRHYDDSQGVGENIYDDEDLYSYSDRHYDDSQGVGENIYDDPNYMNQVTYVIYDDVYEPEDAEVYEPEDAEVYEPEKGYEVVDKQRKPSLWERIKGFFTKLAQRDSVAWQILDVLVDTALISLTGPFYVMAKILVNGMVKWIKTKVEGKLAEYLSQSYA